ncbi:methyl-accepting chemotaxis protein [Metapseudomonas otitidis]|uniref:methyl-accepting chemotaxis protein n=1 Tax=Metapseudomonas otitidis TaxID=319939 RepID=UPI0013F5FF3C|nr:methyl-accepting chemotaxis protein [Pseudomonas otitidis]
MSRSRKTIDLWLKTLIGVIGVSALLLLYSYYSMTQAMNAFISVAENRYQSYLLADELRQSSDDLTRLARTYVVTADPEYERQYMQVLDIRNGKAPRPRNYERIYWDFVAAGDTKPREDTSAVALTDLMKAAGFTPEEFAKLQEAQANSNDLVQTEVKAMSAVKGLFADSAGNYVVKGEPDLALARDLLHSKDYHRYKARIMKPVDDFFVLLDARTQAAVNDSFHAMTAAKQLFIGVLAGLLAAIAALIFVNSLRLKALLGASPTELDQVVTALSQGNLAIRFPAYGSGSVMENLHTMNTTLKAMIEKSLRTSRSLLGSIEQISNSVSSASQRSRQQSEMSEMMATAVHEMAATVQEIAGSANQAAKASQRALTEVQSAGNAVNESSRRIESMASDISHASDAVGQLASQVASIDQVLAVIRSISEQTNLLALNAAIEAARAGEMGRGFAVVADEVRTLAGRTQGSTDEIQQMIAGLKKGAEDAVASMQTGQSATDNGVQEALKTRQSLKVIAEQIEAISDMNRQAATATEEQSITTDDISHNITNVADLAKAARSDLQNCVESCQSLRQLSEELAQEMSAFRL